MDNLQLNNIASDSTLRPLKGFGLRQLSVMSLEFALLSTLLTS